MSFDLPSNLQVHLPPQRVTWNIGKLKHPRFRNSYKEVFTENLQIILPHQSSFSFPNRTEACQYIDSIHQPLCDAIYDSLNKICGRRSPPTDEWLMDFWTTEMTAAFNCKEYYYKKWKKAHGFNALRLWVAHQEAQAKLRQLILKRRRETWRCFCDQMSQGNYSKAIAKFSRIRKNRTIKPTFSHIEGPQRAADVMMQHLQHTFAGDLLSNFTESTPSTSHNEPFDTSTCPFTIETVNDAIAHLPRRKAPGVDHLTIETILPITDRLTPILVYLFQLFWRWSYTPLSWRVAQVLPIYKKGPVTDPGNFHSISLTSIFRKIVEKCLYPELVDQIPTLDIAQGGFRVARSTLDQALSLVEICSILRKHHKVTPTLAFLDIKSAYDTVDRRHVWQALEQSLDPALLNLLKNLFNDVQIEVFLGNAKSSRFSPVTGVLQGSILSPFLYSIYVNQLPNLLRDHPLLMVLRLIPLNLLYQSTVSYYALYGIILPRQVSFSYLGIPISPGGYLNTKKLIQNNINKALKTMNQMTAIDIVRPQLEYGLAISAVKSRELQKIESCQNQCLRRIFGGTSRSSIKVMLHLLTTSPLWRLCAETDPDQLDRRKFKAIHTNSILLSACRPQLIVDPILWLPMSYIERSRLIRWRMGWLPGGRPKPCIYHPHDLLTRSHAITCLNMHHRLLMPSTVSDPLSYLLNLLPTSRKKPTIQRRSKYSAWFIRWPIICQILHELDCLHHDKTAPEIPPLDTKLLLCSPNCAIGGFISFFGFQRPAPHFSSLFNSPLPDGTPVEDLSTKWFRNLDMLPLDSLPPTYPRTSKSSWNKFWNVSIPHPACTILWRLYHSKLPTRSRLHKIMPRYITDEGCMMCGAIEIDEHFLWFCPSKRPIWDTLAQRFLEQLLKLSFDQINQPYQTTAKTLSHWKIDTFHVIACGVLSLWRLHWKYIFEDTPFWPNEAAAIATALLRRIHNENSHS
ncbi:hypothetical protein G6F48_011664 [Rhizopus delemar]|nr:hypothetical protein G6F48_011664 [Rhizopus delemar]KAG1630594.1 hypothetical protein G6F44_011290 [Rhizopus delemar]